MVVEVNCRAELSGTRLEGEADLPKDPTNDAGRARVVIEDAHSQYVSILSEAFIQRLLEIGKVRHWTQLQYIWIPSDLLLCRLGKCRVMVGMRKSQTIVDEDGFWLRGHDGAQEYMCL